MIQPAATSPLSLVAPLATKGVSAGGGDFALLLAGAAPVAVPGVPGAGDRPAIAGIGTILPAAPAGDDTPAPPIATDGAATADLGTILTAVPVPAAPIAIDRPATAPVPVLPASPVPDDVPVAADVAPALPVAFRPAAPAGGRSPASSVADAPALVDDDATSGEAAVPALAVDPSPIIGVTIPVSVPVMPVAIPAPVPAPPAASAPARATVAAPPPPLFTPLAPVAGQAPIAAVAPAVQPAGPVAGTVAPTTSLVARPDPAPPTPDVTPQRGQPPAVASTLQPSPAQPQQLAAGTTAPAAQAFAAAIQAADRQDRLAGPASRTEATPADPLAAFGLTAATSAVAPSANADQAALDMRHPAWPTAMIDQIEKLRDAADAGSTRIRVVPDALGGIDVSLRRHDDGVMQVSFAADQPATRALLAQAQPELTRLGEARGLRFADTSSAAADPGAGQRQPQPQATTPRAPASAARFSDDHDGEPADGRVA